MSKLQGLVIKRLEAAGCYVVNVTSASKNGVPDIVGCLPSGQFFAIEVKEAGDRLSDLQRYNLTTITSKSGLSYIATSSLGVAMWIKKYIPSRMST